MIAPDVLHLIPCREVQTDMSNYHRCNVLGLTTSIRSTAAPPFPVVQRQLLVLLVWTGGDGIGDLILRIMSDGSSAPVFRTRPRKVRFAGDTTAVGGVVFRVQNCSFPTAGLYWVEILFGGEVIGRQRLFLRE